MQLVQAQPVQIVGSAVSQALIQQQTTNNSPLAASASTAAVQQVQTPIKFDVPVFEGDSAASWLTWSQRVIYQARVCDFKAELTAAEREGLSVGAVGFYGRSVDPVGLQNAHTRSMDGAH